MGFSVAGGRPARRRIFGPSRVGALVRSVHFPRVRAPRPVPGPSEAPQEGSSCSHECECYSLRRCWPGLGLRISLAAGQSGLLSPCVRLDRTACSALRPRAVCGVPHSARLEGLRRTSRHPIRPVLKHGPRSLTCARVTGCTKPKGAMKVKTPFLGGLGGIPAPSWAGRTAGPSRPLVR